VFSNTSLDTRTTTLRRSQYPKVSHNVIPCQCIVSAEINRLRHTDVLHSFHALALHEVRAAFIHSLFYLSPDSLDKQTLEQMWFAATHYELGKAPAGVSSLNDPPLAWGISMLWNAGFPFDNEALQERFPNIGRVITLEDLPNIMQWAGADIRQTYKGWWKFLGWRKRVPNEKHTETQKTNEEIHPTVQLRGFGATRPEEAVAKHKFIKSQLGGTDSWSQSSQSSGGSREIPMPKLTPIEVHLLGLRNKSCS
jgi:hypothetical protein